MCTYSCGYIFYQIFVAVLLPAGVVTFFFLPPYFGVLLILLSFVSRLQWSRIRARVGCRLGYAPENEKSLIKLMRKNKRYTIVGSAWDFYQKRTVPPYSVIYLYNFYNSVPINQTYDNTNSLHWWRAGTTIEIVAAYYKTLNKAFPSLPSLETATLGAWIMSGSHGSSGDNGKPSNACFGYVHYMNELKELKVVEYKEFDKTKAILIVHISFNLKAMEPNFWLHKRAVKVDPENPLTGVVEWLRPSYQRAMFVGKRILALQWTKEKIGFEKEHIDPHCCSRFCLWIQADPCNAVCGCCLEPPKAYASKVKLYEVNRFVPPAWRIPLFACAGIPHRNYEIFCLLPASTQTDNGVNLFFVSLVQNLFEVHKTYGGRTELRFGGKVLFVDVSLTRKFDSVFQVLEDLGVSAYALHEGKFQYTPPVTRMQQVSVKRLMDTASERKIKLRF